MPLPAEVDHGADTTSATTLIDIRASLHITRKPTLLQQRENYREIQWWLKSALLIFVEKGDLKAAADLIAAPQNGQQTITIQVLAPVPINGEKFGIYATKQWHPQNTMQYMADWANGLSIENAGKKHEHGQKKRVPITGVDEMVCFEGFCMAIAGTRYVSFHCYPNSPDKH